MPGKLTLLVAENILLNLNPIEIERSGAFGLFSLQSKHSID